MTQPPSSSPGRNEAKRPAEKIESAEKPVAAKPTPTQCPVLEEIYAYRIKVRQAYNDRKFDELEALAAEARGKKETFKNGSWKIVQFHLSFSCENKEPESMWKLHDTIHREWVDAKPQSITANVALANFLIEYAWLARGNGYANTVTEGGWRYFNERLAQAREVLRQGNGLAEKDPYWALSTLKVARGQGWELKDITQLVEEASAAEPSFGGITPSIRSRFSLDGLGRLGIGSGTQKRLRPAPRDSGMSLMPASSSI